MNSKNNNSVFDERDDRLGEQLRDQAMAERPAFSAEVHDRVMRGIRSNSGSKRREWNGLLATAAAILIFSSMISIRWLIPGLHQELAIKNVSDHSTQMPPPIAPLPDQPIQLTVNFDGLVSLKISPLQVSITSPILASNPIAVEPPSMAASSEPIGSPDWLLTKLQEPASLAQATLADLMPTDMQRLIRQASMNQ